MFHIRSHIFHFKHNNIKQSCNYISQPQCLNINIDRNTDVIHQSESGLIWTKVLALSQDRQCCGGSVGWAYVGGAGPT